MVRFTPLGGASEIGGSCALLEAFGMRLVIDAGIRPGVTEGKYPDFERITDGGDIDAILVTHAHADHTGALPLLHRLYPDVRVFATAPTVRIARTLLRDSVNIMDREWEGSVDFTLEDVDSLIRASVPVDFNTPTVVASNDEAQVTVKFVRAGHILGAAMLAIEVEELLTERIERILISGDISMFDQPTIRGTAVEEVRDFRPSLFVCEGTYGTDVHNDMALEEARFVERVAKVLRRDGRVLIPAFAVGRAQNVALILKDAFENPKKYGRILGDPDFSMPEAMVVIDGMCRSIADQYSAFRNLLRDDLQERRSEHVFYDASGILRPVRSSLERRDYTQAPGPIVYISSSGMLIGGPSVAYARALAPEENSAILLCGYQDEESPGRALINLTRKNSGQEYPVARLGGKDVEVRCEVDQYGLSAHSDADDIMSMFEAVKPMRMLLVHGTPTRLAALQQKLKDRATEIGLESLIEIAHKDEAVEVDGAERFDEPAFMHSAHELSNWAQKVLTGRALHGTSEITPSSSWVNASLLTGRERPLTDEEVARLDTTSEGRHMLGPDEVAMARESLMIGKGLLWGEQTIGPEVHYVPKLPKIVRCLDCQEYFPKDDPRVQSRICPSCDSNTGFGVPKRQQASLEEIITYTRNRTRVQHRIKPDDVRKHSNRVKKMGIAVGDLVLFVSGSREHIRLVPAVLRERDKSGYDAIAPSATDPYVGFNQIMARVGAWPSPAGLGLEPSPREVQLLDAVARGVSALTVEYLLRAHRPNGGGGAPRDSAKALMSLWQNIPPGSVSPMAASLASVLLANWSPGTVMQVTVDDLVDLFGGSSAASPMIVLNALRELVRGGFLQMREMDSGALQLQWSANAQANLKTRPDTTLIFRELGPSFQALLRRAFESALGEIRDQGILEEYRSRDPFVFQTDYTPMVKSPAEPKALKAAD